MDEIERKTMQDIKDYVKSLDSPDNEVYQNNAILIMSCFSKAMEFMEANAKLRQQGINGLLKAEREAAKQEIREWLISEDFDGLAERI
jgi:type I site-specific restriction endonuclease